MQKNIPNHLPRKRFGQNFLHDQSILQRIVQVLQLKPTDHVVEIGPGLGALTTKILPLLPRLEVVELDRDLVPKLIENCQGLGELIVYQDDALRFDFSQLSQTNRSLRLVGNLPYNISTPLLFHLLEQAHIIKDMYFMLQKEVVDRMVATPGSEAYGRLSVMVQYYCQAQALFTVKPGAFQPPPKVDSAFIRLVPHAQLPHVANDAKIFAQIVRLAFNQRRKTIRNSLATVISIEQLQALNIDPSIRAEKLGVEQFVKMSNSL